MTLRGRLVHLRNDHEIERDVRAELTADQSTSGTDLVGLAVDSGVVSLTGFADSYAQKLAIGRAAGRVLGVREVRDYIQVRLSAEAARSDDELEAAARQALEWDARVPNGIRVEVTDGVMRLRGVVTRFSQREAADDATRNLRGVCDVVNEIRVASVPWSARVLLEVEAAIRRRFGGDAGDISITTATDGEVTLNGVVTTFATLDDVERVVRSVPGVARIDNRLLVA